VQVHCRKFLDFYIVYNKRPRGLKADGFSSGHCWFLCKEWGPITKLSENGECSFFLKERENLGCCYSNPTPSSPPPSKEGGLINHGPQAIEFLWQKVWAIFLCEDFLGEISKPPTKKDLAFVTVPFSFVLWWHFQRFFCDTLHVLRSEKQTCG